MGKFIVKLINGFFKLEWSSINNSLSTLELLKRDLKNCLTMADLDALDEVLKYCKSEIPQEELVTFLLDKGYQKLLIDHCDKQLTCKRYPAHEIKSMFNKTKSIAFCDAILLHVKRNIKYYISDHLTDKDEVLSAMTDTSVFKAMAERKQAILYNHFTTQTPL